MSDYVYQRTEFSPYELYTVGHYDPSGKWQSESDYQIEEEAAKRVDFLNGGQSDELDRLQQENEQLKELLRLALQDLKIAADDNGGCYGCTYLDENEKCTSVQGKIMCDCRTNNMWQWQHADKLKGLIKDE